MNITQLEKKLHNEIPLTKLMELSIVSYDKNKLITKAPLNININDKGTAFGGSLSTMTTISAWSVALLLSKELGVDNSNIVIINCETNFKRPVTKDIICETVVPSKDEIQILKEKLHLKNSGSIKISSQIVEDNNVCVVFNGTYVVKKL